MIYLLIFAKLIKSGLLVKFVVLKMWSYFLSPTKEADIFLFLGIIKKKKKKNHSLGGYTVSIMSNFFFAQHGHPWYWNIYLFSWLLASMLLMHSQCMTHVEKGKFLCKLASQWPENKLGSFSEDYRNCYVT